MVRSMADEITKPPTAQTPPLTIQADATAAPGIYANLAMISHTKEEFVFDFLFVQPQRGPRGEAVGILRSRVVTTPGHTKRVLRALEENLRRYEAAYGMISESVDVPPTLQ